MVGFVTLLLGLVVGTQPVELYVDPSVVAVEIRLDGRSIGLLQSAPWRLACDFGAELEPHELVAVALDEGGEELARARQWINLPQQPAEAVIVLEEGEDGQGTIAHLTWESVVAPEPTAIEFSFDGRPLAVDDPHRIVLPSYDPDRLHFLRAELEFKEGVSSVVEMSLGGAYADEVNIRLTAVAVALGRRAKMPPVAELQGRFTEAGRALEVVAVEAGPAEVIVVRAGGAAELLDALASAGGGAEKQARFGKLSRGSGREALHFQMTLPKEHRVRFLWPHAESQERDGVPFEVFPPSPALTARDGGFYWLLTSLPSPPPAGRAQRLTDAVAAAGLLAAGRNRRRAVVLVLGDHADQDSRLEPAMVRRYLGQLGVPLLVWSASGEDPESQRSWGEVIDVHTLGRLERAVEDLDRLLDRQRIVWLDGRHLPQRIELAVTGKEMRLVR